MSEWIEPHLRPPKPSRYVPLVSRRESRSLVRWRHKRAAGRYALEPGCAHVLNIEQDTERPIYPRYRDLPPGSEARTEWNRREHARKDRKRQELSAQTIGARARLSHVV